MMITLKGQGISAYLDEAEIFVVDKRIITKVFKKFSVIGA